MTRQLDTDSLEDGEWSPAPLVYAPIKRSFDDLDDNLPDAICTIGGCGPLCSRCEPW